MKESVIEDESFKKYIKEYKEKKDDDTEFFDVCIADVLGIENKEIKEKITKHPKYFTEDTLFKFIEIVGNK